MFDKIRRRLGGTMMNVKKATAFNFFPSWMRYVFADYTFRLLAREGYSRQSVVFACLAVHQLMMGEAPMRVYHGEGQDKEPADDHPARKLIRSPNPFMGEAELYSFIVTYCAIGGNCYIWKERSVTGEVIGLWPLHDAQMTPVPDPNGWIAHYLYDENMGQDEVGANSLEVPIEDIIHIRWSPDPLQPVRGLSPLVAASRPIDMDNETLRYTYSLLKNDATPRTALVTNRQLGERDFKRLVNEYEEMYGGDNRGRPMLIEGEGARIERIGANLDELAVEALHNIPESRIASVLRVPPILAGLNSGLLRSSYANYEQARKSYTEDFRMPMWSRWATQFTRQLLLVDFGAGEDFYMEFDTSRVAALQQDEIQLIQVLVAAAGGPIFTPDEARARLGLDSIEGGDELRNAGGGGETPEQLKPFTGEEEKPKAQDDEQDDEDQMEEEPEVKAAEGVMTPERQAVVDELLPQITREFERLRAKVEASGDFDASE